jgi:DNA polymerase III subunit delta'
VSAEASSVFDDVVGQPEAVATLQAAVADADRLVRGEPGPSMTHAWLITGPPGSGRSVAARAFGAALTCASGGCGRCNDCHTVLAGSSPDVAIVVPEGLSYGVKEARRLITEVGEAPVGGRWRVVVVEDADRLTEPAANVLLKTIEEPPPRSVIVLCAPTAEELPPTIRSRCRLVSLRTPSTEAVADVLVRRDGIDPPLALFAARAAQGHVGRARRLATDESARHRRRDVLDLPATVGGVPAALSAAAALVEAASEEASAVTEERDASELAELRTALCDVGKGLPRGTAGVVRELEDRQKSRATRSKRDVLDRALLDLAALYRDVLITQVGAAVPLVNDDLRDRVEQLAVTSRPEQTVRRMSAVLECREALEANVNPLLAVEAMALALR